MKKIVLLTAVTFLSLNVFSQLKIGNNPTTINSNSILELESTNKGLLIPRVALQSTDNAAPLSNFVAGMMIYNTATAGDVTPGFYVSTGSSWSKIDNQTSTTLYNGNGAIPASTTRAVTFGSGSNLNFDANTLYIDGDQSRVGIGTALPSTKLDVTGGQIRIDTDYTLTINRSDNFTHNSKSMSHYGIGWFGDSWDNSGGTAWLSGYSGLKFFSNGTARMSITKDGKVGIGTTSPRGALEVSSTSGWTYLNNSSYGIGNPTTARGLMYAWNNSGSAGESELLWGTGEGTLPNLTISSWDGTTKTPRLVISQDGDIGIYRALHLNGSAGTSGQVLTSAGPNALPTWTTPTAGTTLYEADGSLAGDRTVSQATKTLKFTSTATTGTSHFTVDGTTLNVDAANNRVGIGTATPAQLLDVNGTARFVNGALITPVLTSGTWIDLPTTGPSAIGSGGAGANAWIGYSAASGQWFTNSVTGDIVYRNTVGKLLFGNTSGAASMALSGDKLGIGNIAPSEKLDVTGNIKFSGALMPNNLAGTSGQVLTSAGAGNVPTWTTVATSNLYSANGTLSGNRIVTQGSNTLAFTSSAVNGFSVDGTTFSVDASNNRIGIGNSTPISTLSVSGRAVFGSNLTTNNDSNDDIYLEKNGDYSQMHLYNTDLLNTDINAYISLNRTGSSNGSGNSNPGLNVWTSSNHPIRFSTNATERMVITNAGNLGVGNPSPSEKLDVSGNVRFSGALMPNNLAGTSGQVLTSAGAGNVPTWTTLTTPATYSGSTSITLNSTSFERAALTGDVTATANSNATTIATGAVTSAKILDGTIATGDIATGAVTTTTILDGTIATGDISNSAVTYSKIQNVSANNTLLGRATTGAGDIEEITLGTGLSLSGTTLNAESATTLYNGDGSIPVSTTRAVTFGSASNLNFDANTLFIDGDNNRLGIGTNTPEEKLHIGVSGSNALKIGNIGDANGAMFIGGGATSGVVNWLDFFNGTGVKSGNIFYDQTIGAFFVNNTTSNTIIAGGSGNLGVGNDSPSQKLDVTGNIKFSGALMPNNLAGTSGQVLTSAGAGNVPTWTTLPTATTYSGSTSIALNGTSFERAALTGDVTASANSNATTIATGAVTSAKILDGTIATGDIATGAVTTTTILDGTIATGDVANDAISFAKMQNIATNKLLGRGTASTGDIEEITLGTGLSFSGTTLNAATGNTLYTADGTLSGNRTVTQGTNTLAFTSSATSGTSHFTVDGTTLNVDANNNRVGIGLSNPTAPFEVYNGTTNASYIRISGLGGGGNTTGLHFSPWVARPSAGAKIEGIDDGNGGAYLLFSTINNGTSAAAERLRINSNGNVGVASSSPDEKLHVGVNGGTGFKVGQSGNNIGAILVGGGGASGAVSWLDFYNGSGSKTGNIFLHQTEGFNINNTGSNTIIGVGAGKTGVNTTSPTSTLDVNGGILARGSNSVSFQGAHLQWNRSGFEGETWLLNQKGAGGSNAGIRFGSVTSSNVATEWARFLDNGNFGIGSTNPSGKLDVTGGKIRLDIGQTMTVNTSDNFTYDSKSMSHYGIGWFNDSWNGGGSTAWLSGYGGVKLFASGGLVMSVDNGGTCRNSSGSWTAFSDARVKTVKSEFKDGLNVIKQINPVRFVYNENAPFKTNDVQIGIVAQDLEKVAPYMVTKTNNGEIQDLREVNTQAYVFLLINAVKEQQAQIEEMKKEIEELKKVKR